MDTIAVSNDALIVIIILLTFIFAIIILILFLKISQVRKINEECMNIIEGILVDNVTNDARINYLEKKEDPTSRNLRRVTNHLNSFAKGANENFVIIQKFIDQILENQKKVGSNFTKINDDYQSLSNEINDRSNYIITPQGKKYLETEEVYEDEIELEEELVESIPEIVEKDRLEKVKNLNRNIEELETTVSEINEIAKTLNMSKAEIELVKRISEMRGDDDD